MPAEATRTARVVRVDAGPAADLPPGSTRLVRAGRRELAIVNFDGRLYAIRNLCPHQLGPLGAGRVGPRLVLGPRLGSLEVDEASPVIACPWHGWEFDLASGCALADPQYRVAAYPVAVEDGRLVVEIRD